MSDDAPTPHPTSGDNTVTDLPPSISLSESLEPKAEEGSDKEEGPDKEEGSDKKEGEGQAKNE